MSGPAGVRRLMYAVRIARAAAVALLVLAAFAGLVAVAIYSDPYEP
ncbi:hypothetical protein RKE29_05975 [Streptomyces sp. B1866]|nr:hypothetical protein [Streptomyces sp. B1866]MDT3396188.1 hypothetical protein [Streptomyces sp. B1866]